MKILTSSVFAVERDMWHAKGYSILYETSEPTGPLYHVTTVDRILGICPLMRLYRNVDGTIPEWADGQKAQAYPTGRKSTKGTPGSATFVVNDLGLKFSR